MSFYAQPETRTARTMHTCFMCFRAIQPREQYTVQTSYQDGWVTWRTCAHCEAAVQTAYNLRLLDDEYDGQFLFDALSERSVTTARLAVGIRRKWVAFCGYGLLPVPQVVPRQCCERGCGEPVDMRSYTWCARHDAERIERVSGQLAAIAAEFKSVTVA